MNYKDVNTPCYIVDEKLLIKNLEVLKRVKEESGCKILLAQKAFSMFYTYPLIKQYLDGSVASGLFEARLGYEEMGKEVHCFCVAYKDEEFDEVLKISDHITFNSFNQWKKFKDKAMKTNKSFGLRINPEHSTQTHGIYDPCFSGSRLGIEHKHYENESLVGI